MQTLILLTAIGFYILALSALITFRHKFDKKTKRILAGIALLLSGVITFQIPFLSQINAIPVGITFVICILALDTYSRKPKKNIATKEPVLHKRHEEGYPFNTFDSAKRLLKWMHDNGQFGTKPLPSDAELHKIWDEAQELKKQGKKDTLSDL